MHRAVLAGLTLLLAMPAALRAQAFPTVDAVWENPRLRITPWLAYAAPVGRSETRATRFGDDPTQDRYFAQVDVGTGFGVGVNGEYRVYNRFAGYVGSAVITRGNTVEYSDFDGFYRSELGSFFIATRAGVAARLQERDRDLQLRMLDASVYAGPTWMIELPRRDAIRSRAGAQHLFGVHFGIEGEVPLADRRFSVSAALEDNIVWWNRTELARRADSVFDTFGEASSTAVTSAATHMVMLRLGFSIRTP